MSESKANLALVLSGASVVLSGGAVLYIVSNVPYIKETVETHDEVLIKVTTEIDKLENKINHVSEMLDNSIQETEDDRSSISHINECIRSIKKDLSIISRKQEMIITALQANNIKIDNQSQPLRGRNNRRDDIIINKRDRDVSIGNDIEDIDDPEDTITDPDEIFNLLRKHRK